MADRLRYFTRMNSPIFTGSNTSEYPQVFVDEVHKIFLAMGSTDTEKKELAFYLKLCAKCRKTVEFWVEFR